MVYRRNLKRSNSKSRSNRSNRSLKRSTRRQRGGDRGVHMPIQYFNPGAKVPTYYPAGHAMLTKPYVSSSYGTLSAVNTTNVNQGGLSMGPNLFPSPGSGLMVGGRSNPRSSSRSSTHGRSSSRSSTHGRSSSRSSTHGRSSSRSSTSGHSSTRRT